MSMSMNMSTLKSLTMALALAAAAGGARAADGTWTNLTSGLTWANTAGWAGGTVADGSGFTANFNTLNITADTTVRVNTTRTIGNLTFGDTDGTSAAGWVLDNNATAANALNLAGGTPTITVGALGGTKVVTITGVVTGQLGLTKTGAGTLVLTNVNRYFGGTFINGGTLQVPIDGALGAVPAGSVVSNIVLNGGTFAFSTANGTVNSNRGIGVEAGGATFNNVSAGLVNLRSPIQGVGSVTYTQANAAAGWSVGAASTYTGGTTVAGAGTIYPQANSTGGSPGSPANGPFGAGAAPLVLAGAQMRAGTAADLSIGNTLTLAANMTFPTVASEKSLTFTGPGTLTGSQVLTVNVGATVAGKSIQLSGTIDDGGNGYGLTKAGTGLLILSGESTYAGQTLVTGGTLQIGAGGTAGSVSSAIISNDATLAYSRTDAFSVTNLIAGRGVLNKLSSGTMTLTTANTYTGTTTVGAGALILADPAACGPAGRQINMGNGTRFEFATDSSSVAYILSFGSGNTATIALNRATSGAAITQALGQIICGIATARFEKGSSVSSGTPVLSCAGVNLAAGAATGAASLEPLDVDLLVAGTIGNTAGGANGVKTLNLSGSSTGNLIAGEIQNGPNAGSGNVAISKNGSGRWTLAGTNTYTGATTISSGVLALAASGSIAASTNVAIGSAGVFDVTAAGFTVGSTRTLSGTGIASGTVTVASGGRLAPGIGGIGTLTADAVTMAAGSILDVELTATSNDQVVVTATNGLIIGGGGVNLYQPGTLTPFTDNGSYILFQFVGTVFGGGAATLSVANPQVGKLYSFQQVGNFIVLNINDAGAAAYWNVDADGLWPDGLNWTGGTAPNGAGGFAGFGGGGTPITAPRAVALDGNKTLGTLLFDSAQPFTINVGTGGTLTLNNGAAAGLIIVSNGAHDVLVPIAVPTAGASVDTFAGSTVKFGGSVTGFGPIAKSGGGSAILIADNSSHSGALTIGAGLVQVGDGGTAGTLGSGAVANNGALTFNRSDSALVVGNAISGTGSVLQAGSGATTLAGTNTFSGAASITSGTLVVQGGVALPDAGTVAIADVAGASLKLDSSETIALLTGGGTTGGAVDLQTNTLTLAGATGGTFAGTIGGSGSVVKTGAGTATFVGASTYTNGTTISGGVLVASNSAALGTGPVTFNIGATRLVLGDNVTFVNELVVNGGGVASRGLIENAGNANATLSGGPITLNAPLQGGSHFGSTTGGSLTVLSPVYSASGFVGARLGTVIVGGGGSYTSFIAFADTTRLANDNGLATNAVLRVSEAGGATANFDMAGFNQTLIGIIKGAGTTANIGNSSLVSNSLLTIVGTSVYAGVIRDTLGAGTCKVAVAVDGGDLTLSGANLFSGGLTITNGVVNTGVAGGLGVGPVFLADGGVLNLTGGGLTYTALTNGLNGTGTVNVTLGTGTASTLLNGPNGGFTGELNVGVGAAAGAGKIQLNGPLAAEARVNALTNGTVYVTGAVTQHAGIVLYGGDTGESLGQLRLDNGATWAGPVTLAGPITGAGDGSIGANAGTGVIAGPIGEVDGPRDLSKVGGAGLTLSGTNTYSGLTTVNAGTLFLAAGGTLGDTTAGTVVSNGGALALTAGAVGPAGEGVVIAGSGNNFRGPLQGFSGASTWNGPVSVVAQDTRIGVQDGAQLTVNGAITEGIPGLRLLFRHSGTDGSDIYLTSTNNAWTGETQIFGGAGGLHLGNHNVLPTGTILRVGASGIAGRSLLDLNGFNQTVAGVSRVSAGPGYLVNHGTNDSTLTLVPATSVQFYGEIHDGTGRVHVVKAGSFTQQFASNNLYSGTTRVEGGMLELIGSGSISNSTSIVVQAGAVLAVTGRVDGALTLSAAQSFGGSGVVLGSVTNAGTTAPGSSAGILTVGGDLLQTGPLSIEIGGNVQGTDYDALVVSNTAVFLGDLNVSFVNSYTGVPGHTFVIASAGSLAAAFTATNLPPLGAGQAWTGEQIGSTYVLSITNTATPPAGYDLFALAITNGLTGYQDDADGDGYANLLEYVTGGNPTNADTNARMSGGRTNGLLKLEFLRDTAATDATIFVEASYTATNDAPWTGIATNLGGSWGDSPTNVTESGSSPVNVTVQDTEAGATNRFLRLRVTRP